MTQKVLHYQLVIFFVHALLIQNLKSVSKWVANIWKITVITYLLENLIHIRLGAICFCKIFYFSVILFSVSPEVGIPPFHQGGGSSERFLTGKHSHNVRRSLDCVADILATACALYWLNMGFLCELQAYSSIYLAWNSSDAVGIVRYQALTRSLKQVIKNKTKKTGFTSSL